MAADHPVIRVALPAHLRRLARDERAEWQVDVDGTPTIAGVLDALERLHPMLRGTIRDHGRGKRRPFIRFYAGSRDLSNDSPDSPLPPDVASGDEVLRIIGAIAGG